MSFSSIYGHRRQIGMLQKAMAQKRIGHSYLLGGLDAIGKKTLALAFAQALNCLTPDAESGACGQCPSCRKMIHGSHPDIHVLTTQAQFIRIDAIRAIQDQMTFRPLEGGRRIVIIDEADRMNEQAANALLKTLEEPARENLIILVSARPYFLPQTILSRCRHIRFNPLPAETVARFLAERKNMEPSKARLLASLSGGSIGRALELDSEDMIAFRTQLGRLLAARDRGEPLKRLTLASFLNQDKKEIRQGMAILNTYFRDALVYRETARSSLIVNADDLPAVSSLADRLPPDQILQNIALVEKSSEILEMNVNKSLTIEAMAFKLHL